MNATSTTAAPVRRHLRAHQARSRDRILGQLATNDRTLLVSACGTGKTITLHSVICGRNARRVVAFFPSLSLVDQTIEAWGAQFEGRMRAVVVCSDETVGQRFKSASASDDFAVSDDDLTAAGAEVVRDVDELSLILQTHDVEDVPLVVFSTNQSSEKVAHAQSNTGVRFDLLIADEAHKLATSSRDAATARSGKLILDANSILADKRVFATATPKTFSYSSSAENHRGGEASMDDESLFGGIADTVGLREAIDRGLLTDYRIHIMGVTSDAARAAMSVDLGDIDADNDDVRMALGVAALQRAQVELGVSRVIVYLRSRRRAHQFARLVREQGLADCSVITGDQSASERQPKLEALARNGGVIANVRCLTEGVDVPSLDAVLFVDPRSSKIDIVQAVGRAVRLADNKTLGHVILPVLHDPGTPDEGWLEGNGYRGVWDVLAQMAENDTALRAHLGSLIVRDEKESGHVPGDLGSTEGARIIETHFAEDLVDLSSLVMLRAAQLNDVLTHAWRSSANALRAFIRDNGHWPERDSLGSEEARLYFWLRTQRTSMRKGILSAERQAYLNRHIPNWRAEDRDDAFASKLSALVLFIAENGRFPSHGLSAGEAERVLGAWLNQIRVYARSGKKRLVTPEREAALDAQAPGWRGKQIVKRSWESTFSECVAFVARHGGFPRPALGDTHERALGKWLSRQRWLTEIADSPLGADKIKQLDERLPGWRTKGKNARKRLATAA